MQRHVTQRETARTEMRWFGRGCLRLGVEGKILKETWKKPALDAVAVVKGFLAVLLVGPSQLWIVTERGSG